MKTWSNEIIEQKTNSIVANNICEMLMTLVNVIKQEVYFKWNLLTFSFS